ncbi:MAG: outer membrane lipoprotein-sorting protein [FCB group bacterium]|nr:outer membrane lipoprotein-sorting protein [FCB group bacterium]
MKSIGWMIVLFISGILRGQNPDGTEILKRIDENQVTRNQVVVSTMTIHGRRGSRTLKAKSWIVGDEKSFSEYLAPPRDAGTKMLKLGDELWLYTPASDRSIKIAGHMLRQSLMGSDLSYEDMLENSRLSDRYSPELIGSEMVHGRDCWILNLTGKENDLPYAARKIWVDKERWIVLKENRYAKSGRLLKQTDVTDVFQVDGRWIPRTILFKDALSKGKGTEFHIDSLELDVDIPSAVFSKAALRR